MDEEKNVIAILMEKITLSEGKYLFKPFEVLKGTLNEKTSILKTSHETEYLSMSDTSLALSELSECYGCEITSEELSNKYKGSSKSEALKKYFKEVCNYIYVGTYHHGKNKIEIKKMSYDNVNDKSINKTNKNDPLLIELSIADIDLLLAEEDLQHVRNKLLAYKNVLKSSMEQSSVQSQTTSNASSNVSSLASKDNTSKNTKVKEADDKVTVKPKINVDDLFKKISSSVKSQDDPLEDIITTIAMNYECLKNQKKSHILVTGPTGSGKSEIMKQVSEYINVPIAEYDMTQVSVAGYVGKNVDDALVRLYYAANKDIVAAQNGILVLDEIDKKASHSSSNGDVSGRDVLNSLLKLLDGTVFDLEIGQRNVPFSTNNLTVVAMGAFATMTKNHPLGFTGQVNNIKPMFNIEDFVNFGMPAEFMGRMSSIITLNELSVEDLINILATSSISPLLMKKDILSRLGVSLNYTDDYIEAVAKRAVELKTGARSLGTIVYKSLLKAESAILRNSCYKELIIDNETVNNNKVFVLK